MIPVTKPFIPDLNLYQQYLKGIWEREYFTNNGPLVRELEMKLEDYLKINQVCYLNNGTIALQIAIKALELKGEIITTPFSFVATTSSIVWEGCTPVFADIDESTFNINPLKIEKLINENTCAILATHCFGNACDIDAIEKIAKKHDLKVIYDAAHCFGTKYKGKSVFEYGDISTTSFHATKLFHTIEGGAIFCNDPILFQSIRRMRNFGHDGPDKFTGVGINGKNSEFHAAMGLCVLPEIESILFRRKEISEVYQNEFWSCKAIQLIKIQENCEFNYAYFPIVLKSENLLLKVKHALEENNISPRRYFYPSLSTLDYVGNDITPISNDISKRVLCLPIYHNLLLNELQLICSIIKNSI